MRCCEKENSCSHSHPPHDLTKYSRDISGNVNELRLHNNTMFLFNCNFIILKIKHNRIFKWSNKTVYIIQNMFTVKKSTLMVSYYCHLYHNYITLNFYKLNKYKLKQLFNKHIHLFRPSKIIYKNEIIKQN